MTLQTALLVAECQQLADKAGGPPAPGCTKALVLLAEEVLRLRQENENIRIRLTAAEKITEHAYAEVTKLRSRYPRRRVR